MIIRKINHAENEAIIEAWYGSKEICINSKCIDTFDTENMISDIENIANNFIISFLMIA
jgi:hypothetical protein